MKAIINNKIYDTDKCESLFTYHRRILKKGLSVNIILIKKERR